MTNQKAVVVPKQLKKQDFLDAVSETPMTKQQLVDKLSGFTFIKTYLTYLEDHFVANGKIIHNEDGTIQRKGKKKSVDREMFRVVFTGNEDGTESYEVENAPLVADEIKGDEWAMTAGAAVKKYCSRVFKQYNDRMKLIKALAPKAA